MPCGGIYPIKGSWMEKYAKPPRSCFFCGEHDSTHFCDEWDCYLHEGCIDGFLDTPEGRIVIDHGHEVIREWKLDG